jgi:hypothetical protein
VYIKQGTQSQKASLLLGADTIIATAEMQDLSSEKYFFFISCKFTIYSTN